MQEQKQHKERKLEKTCERRTVRKDGYEFEWGEEETHLAVETRVYFRDISVSIRSRRSTSISPKHPTTAKRLANIVECSMAVRIYWPRMAKAYEKVLPDSVRRAGGTGGVGNWVAGREEANKEIVKCRGGGRVVESVEEDDWSWKVINDKWWIVFVIVWFII